MNQTKTNRSAALDRTATGVYVALRGGEGVLYIGPDSRAFAACTHAVDQFNEWQLTYSISTEIAWGPLIYEPVHEISNNVVCATNKGSDQPAHTRSLIRAFARRLNILWVLSYWPDIFWMF